MGVSKWSVYFFPLRMAELRFEVSYDGTCNGLQQGAVVQYAAKAKPFSLRLKCTVVDFTKLFLT